MPSALGNQAGSPGLYARLRHVVAQHYSHGHEKPRSRLLVGTERDGIAAKLNGHDLAADLFCQKENDRIAGLHRRRPGRGCQHHFGGPAAEL